MQSTNAGKYAMLILVIVVFIIFGLFIGSFLNVCIDRLPQGQSIVSPPSHCSDCNRKLSVLDLIPLFSYLWLRGRCRYCRARIPLRLPIVEGVTGLLFGLLCWKFGLEIELGISLVYVCLLILIFVIDFENRVVLSVVVYPGMVFAFAFAFFWPGLGEVISLPTEVLRNAVSSLAGGAVGSLAFALPLIFYRLIMHREGMGLGDVQLGAMVGLMLGFPLVIVAVLLSWIAGGLVGVVLLAFRVMKREDSVPFAPFLVTSAFVTLLWGQAIWQWYLP